MSNAKNFYPIYLEYFKGRKDYFACQGKDFFFPVKEVLDGEYLHKHLKNLATFGIYVLTADSKCNFLCIDIDIPKNELDTIDVTDSTKKFSYLKEKIFKLLEVLNKKLKIDNMSILLEDTGGRGYHIWIFFAEGIDAEKVVKLHRIIKNFVDFDFEFFPKQPSINEKRRFGNLIKLPLGIHQKYKSQSSFLELNNRKVKAIRSLEENLSYLTKINRIPTEKIDQIIEQNKDLLKTVKIESINAEKFQQIERPLYIKDLDFLFAKCSALNRLKTKAEKGIQFSHQEAFHFTNIMLSVENTDELIQKCLKHSFGTKFNPEKTEREIEKIKPLYPSSCGKLIDHKICDGYCNDAIKRKNLDDLLPNTSPLSEWLTFKRKKQTIKKDEILEKIADPNNIKNAYWKLKKYHKDEDSLFYDEFDFEYFEKNLEINAKYISKTFITKTDIPFIGYLKVEVPKKIDDTNKMQYRQLVYSTIFDQIIIQAIFNIIAQIIEEDFQKYSFGYRADTENIYSENIFYDWRKYYPRFRNNVLSKLRHQKIKYYVCCDIKGFYDNIDHHILLEQLKKYVIDDYVLPHIEKVIKAYNFEENSHKGIPQGPAYARILANLYLNEFDKDILLHSAGYFRYVDDFFLFYQSREDAEKGLEKVVELLNNLGLSLPEDEEKRPRILEAGNEDLIVSKLDNIQYGIFEEFKFIDYLDIEQINNFYDAIEKYRASPSTIKEILEINNKLPSILYLLSTNFKFDHSMKNKVLSLINYLINKEAFYPKRLKYIFYRIIDLMEEFKQDIVELYNKLHKTHKIYFLLSLFKIYRSDKKFEEELKKIVESGLKEDNHFLKGFALMINNELEKGKKADINNDAFLEKTLNCTSYFPKIKLFNVLSYFKIDIERRQIIRDRISENNTYLEKKYLLSNLEYLNIIHIDNIYILNLLKSNSFLLIPECCEIFSAIRECNTLFRDLEKYISGQVNYKEISMYYLSTVMFERYKNSGPTDLANLIQLYKEIKDSEIKRVLLNEANRIQKFSPFTEDNFSKKHELVSRYNGCLYFENINKQKNEYDFIEFLPNLKLSEYGYSDLEDLKNSLQNMAFAGVLPELNFEFDSKKNQVSIKYTLPNDYIKFEKLSASLNDRDILLVLELMENIYKKADYFFRQFAIIPYINTKNLLVNTKNKEIYFMTFGSTLCPSYSLPGKNVNNNDENTIQELISSLLKEIFFGNEDEKVKEFCKVSSKLGIKLFLAHFINRMSSKNPDLRYTYKRFNYIIEELKNSKTGSNYEITSLYFKERLKARLFENNADDINWFYICNALKDIYKESAITYDSIDFTSIKFKNRTFLNLDLPRNLHYLSKLLLNICLNIDNLLENGNSRNNFINLFELLNYYAILCIETISFFKICISSSDKTLPSIALENEIFLSANDYKLKYNTNDLNTVQTMMQKDEINQNIFESSVNFTLKQLTFYYNIKLFSSKLKGDTLFIENTSKIKPKYFDLLSLNLLTRLPKIEDGINLQIRNVLVSLKTDQDYYIADHSMALKNDIKNFCKEINKIRKKMRYKRFYGKRTKIKRWPPHIYCRRLWVKLHKTVDKSLFKIPLSNLFPSSKSTCSWDLYKGTIHNLVIPNERINKLTLRLKKGKLFGLKITYIYSEKTKLLWDICLVFVLSIIVVFILSLTENVDTIVAKTFYWLLNFILCYGILFFLIKIFKDIKYWSGDLYKIIEYIKK